MIKILFIHHAADWGGASINLVNIINNLDRSKFSPSVLIFKKSIVSQKLSENKIPFSLIRNNFYRSFYRFYIHTLPTYTRWYRLDHILRLTLSWLLSRYYYAKKELNTEFDIIHLNSSILTDWLAPCSRVSKVVMHIQEPVAFGLIGLRHRFFRSEINKYANHIIAISQDNANRVNIPQKTTVVYNFLKLPTCEVLEKKYHTKKVLYLGGAAYIKGFHILVDCLDYLDSDITVIFAGYYPKRLSNNFKSKLKLILRKKRVIIEALKKISTKKNCIHIGLISDIEPVFKNVCCLVSPFTIEHFSRPIIEAFAHYTPVIASNIDGIGEIVDHNYDGLIFAKNNHIELAHAINYLCNTPEIAKKMGLNGRKKAAELYTSKNIFKITCIYEYLMKE